MLARERSLLLLELKLARERLRWARLLATSCFLLILDAVTVARGWLQSTDKSLWIRFASTLGQRGFEIVEGISLAGVVGDSDRYLAAIAIAGTLLVAIAFTIRGMAFTGAVLVVSITGCAAMVQVLKRVVDRSGPPLTPWTPLGHTFPSGTAAIAVVFFGFLASICLQRARGAARLYGVIASVIACLALVISSLTYHFPTEVIGGIATGAAWLSFMQILFWRPLRQELSV